MNNGTVVVLTLALIFSIGVNSALLTAFFSWRGGTNPAMAGLRGGAALGGTLLIGIALLNMLHLM